MMDKRRRKYSILLTEDEADELWGQVDGWIDAGLCRGGNTSEESALLVKLRDSLTLPRTKKEPTK